MNIILLTLYKFLKKTLFKNPKNSLREILINKAVNDSKKLGGALIIVSFSIYFVGASALFILWYFLDRYKTSLEPVHLYWVIAIFVVALLSAGITIHYIYCKISFYKRAATVTNEIKTLSFLDPLFHELKSERSKMKNNIQSSKQLSKNKISR